MTFFATDERIEKLQSIIQSWMGTPYLHFCRVKGRGVDCAFLLVEIFREYGFYDSFSCRYYARDWHIHGKTEIFLEGMEQLKEVIDVAPNGVRVEKLYYTPSTELKLGDWLVFSMSPKGLRNHSGIYFPEGKLTHSLEYDGVICEKIEKYLPKLDVIFRFVEDVV